jgi:transposase-like protein
LVDTFQESTMAVQMTKRKRRKFTPEFKAETVRLVRQSNKTISEIARDLDLTESALRQWVEQATVDDGGGPPGALTTTEREELTRLRRENKVLQQEREILKKAAAFFAKENT